MRDFVIKSNKEAEKLANIIYKGCANPKEVKLLFTEFAKYLLQNQSKIKADDMLKIVKNDDYMNANKSNKFLNLYTRKIGLEMFPLSIVVGTYIIWLENYLGIYHED